MKSSLLGGLAAGFLLFASPLAAQDQVAGQTMLVAGDYLFVIRDGVLYQFDKDTLKVRHRFTFPRGALVAAAAEPGAVVATREGPAAGWSRGVDKDRLPAARKLEELAGGVNLALQWLARHQDQDGRFDADGFMKHDTAGEVCDGPGNAVHDVGVTGLALLAFLGDGSTMAKGPWHEQIRGAAKWLQSQQDPKTGLFGTAASHDFVYDHAIAAYAICEAYGLSDHAPLKAVAQRAIDYLESHRNPYAVWRYQPRDNDNDTSVTTWALAACISAKYFGLEVDPNAARMAAVWYDQVTSPDGRAGYTKQGEPSSRKPGDHANRFPVELGEAMTAAALFGRMFLGQDPKENPVIRAAADRLLANLPAWEKDRIDPVYWYFGTYGMFQVGGAHWDAWSRALGMLLDQQRQKGNAAGSWDPIGVWDEDGGRVFVTALNALSLQAVSRHARLVR